MASFDTIIGDLFVGESAEDDERYDDGEHLYRKAVFVSDAVPLVFYSGIGGYYRVRPDAFVNEGNNTTFYPYQNETTVEPTFRVEEDELELLREGVQLRYALVDSKMYVRSQNEPTAYDPNHLVQNGNIYEYGRFRAPSEPDPFLELDKVDDPVYVENVESGYRVPKDADTVISLVNNDEPNGALEVTEPRDSLSDAFRSF